MITIKKGPMTITREINDIKAVADTADGIYIKFQDDTEIIFTMALTPAMKAIVARVEQISAKDFTLDLNNSINPLQITG